MIPVALRPAPALRSRGKRRVFEFKSILKFLHHSGQGDSGGITRPPDDRQPQPFLHGHDPLGQTGSYMRPGEQYSGRADRFAVPDPRQIFVRQRCGDKRIDPRAVAVGPIAHHGGKPPDLQARASVGPRRDPQRIFVQPHLARSIRRVEAPIEAGLGKKVHLPPGLCIEKKSQPWIQQRIAVRVDDTRCHRLKFIGLEVQHATEPRPELSLGSADRQGIPDPVEKFVGRAGADRTPAEPKRSQATGFHATVGVVGVGAEASRKLTSNSVHSASERARRKSPR